MRSEPAPLGCSASIANLTQSALFRQLPCPSIREPTRSSVLELLEAKATDAALQEANELLHIVDTSSLCPLKGVNADPGCLTLVQECIAKQTYQDVFAVRPTAGRVVETLPSNQEAQGDAPQKQRPVKVGNPVLKLAAGNKRQRICVQDTQDTDAFPKIHLGQVETAIKLFLRKHKQADTDAESLDGSELSQEDDVESDLEDSRGQVSLRGIEQLCENLSQCQDRLHELSRALLSDMLASLQGIIRQGLHARIRNKHDRDSESFQSSLQCLQACLGCLIIMTAKDMPKHIFDEDTILSIVEAIKGHLLFNVLAPNDARIAQTHHAGAPPSCSQNRQLCGTWEIGPQRAKQQVKLLRWTRRKLPPGVWEKGA